MKNVLAFFGFLIFVTSAVAQNKKTVFIDENMVSISDLEFHKKKKSELYYSLAYDLDSISVNRLFLKYFIGRLSYKKRNQLFKILSQRNNLDTTKSILIHYKDTLPALLRFPKKDSIINLENGKHRHLISHRTFVKQHSVCESSYSNKKIKMYHFYSFNEGHPENIGKLSWHRDPLNILRRLFYNRSDNSRFWTILIHKNGDFVINNAGIKPEKKWRHLKAHKNWEELKKDFKTEYYSLNPKLAPPKNFK